MRTKRTEQRMSALVLGFAVATMLTGCGSSTPSRDTSPIEWVKQLASSQEKDPAASRICKDGPGAYFENSGLSLAASTSSTIGKARDVYRAFTTKTTPNIVRFPSDQLRKSAAICVYAGNLRKVGNYKGSHVVTFDTEDHTNSAIIGAW